MFRPFLGGPGGPPKRLCSLGTHAASNNLLAPSGPKDCFGGPWHARASQRPLAQQGGKACMCQGPPKQPFARRSRALLLVHNRNKLALAPEGPHGALPGPKHALFGGARPPQLAPFSGAPPILGGPHWLDMFWPRFSLGGLCMQRPPKSLLWPLYFITGPLWPRIGGGRPPPKQPWAPDSGAQEQGCVLKHQLRALEQVVIPQGDPP